MRFLLATEEGLTIGDFEIARVIAESIEVLAIVVISVAVVAAFVGASTVGFRSDSEGALQTFKRTMARGLLIGLDLLIAADIIKTVTLEATLENATVLIADDSSVAMTPSTSASSWPRRGSSGSIGEWYSKCIGYSI